MFVHVFCDYLNAFRWGKIKEAFGNFTFGWLFIYVLVIYPFMILRIWEDNWFSYYGSVIPACFIGFSMCVTEVRLPKLMLLCPLDREERKKYLYLMFAARLFAPMTPGLVLYGVGCYRINVSPVCCAVGIFSLFSFALCACISSSWQRNGYKNGKWSGRRPQREIPEELKGLEPAGLTGVGVGIVLLAGSVAFMNFGTWRWLDAVWAAAIVLELILDILAVRYIRPVVEIAADYERTCDYLDN